MNDWDRCDILIRKTLAFAIRLKMGVLDIYDLFSIDNRFFFFFSFFFVVGYNPVLDHGKDKGLRFFLASRYRQAKFL